MELVRDINGNEVISPQSKSNHSIEMKTLSRKRNYSSSTSDSSSSVAENIEKNLKLDSIISGKGY